jgi:hypothetical protein
MLTILIVADRLPDIFAAGAVATDIDLLINERPQRVGQ